ncbi:hypothetical protein A3768_5210 (plasmid) [Ralstonia solanacearum]|nr:hypothetical protein A3768_5210 [Ralstonia solanacearum]
MAGPFAETPGRPAHTGISGRPNAARLGRRGTQARLPRRAA